MSAATAPNPSRPVAPAARHRVAARLVHGLALAAGWVALGCAAQTAEVAQTGAAWQAAQALASRLQVPAGFVVEPWALVPGARQQIGRAHV